MKALYERHSDALYHFIRSRLRDPFEAGDVMQEVFLEIWRAAARFEGRSAAQDLDLRHRPQQGGRPDAARRADGRWPSRIWRYRTTRPNPRRSRRRRATPPACASASRG